MTFCCRTVTPRQPPWEVGTVAHMIPLSWDRLLMRGDWFIGRKQQWNWICFDRCGDRKPYGFEECYSVTYKVLEIPDVCSYLTGASETTPLTSPDLVSCTQHSEKKKSAFGIRHDEHSTQAQWSASTQEEMLIVFDKWKQKEVEVMVQKVGTLCFSSIGCKFYRDSTE